MSTETTDVCSLCHLDRVHAIHTDKNYAYKDGKIVAHPFGIKR